MDGQGNQTSGPSGLLQAIRFINPDEGGTQNAATIVHSHAARTAHARRRRARVVAYQASRGVGQPQGDPLQIPNGAIDGVTAMSPYGSHHASPEVIGSGRSDPFASFARPFSPLETFLLDHYIAHIVPRMKSQCRGLRARGQVYADAMTADWVRLALTNPECLNSLFLNAARHASVSHQQEQQQERFAELAVRYKLLSVRAVSRAIASSDGEARGFDDAVFAEILALAFDEVLLGETAMTKRHVQGALRMVELNGGWSALGLDGFLEMLLLRYVERVGLLAQVTLAPATAGGGPAGI